MLLLFIEDHCTWPLDLTTGPPYRMLNRQDLIIWWLVRHVPTVNLLPFLPLCCSADVLAVTHTQLQWRKKSHLMRFDMHHINVALTLCLRAAILWVSGIHAISFCNSCTIIFAVLYWFGCLEQRAPQSHSIWLCSINILPIISIPFPFLFLFPIIFSAQVTPDTPVLGAIEPADGNWDIACKWIICNYCDLREWMKGFSHTIKFIFIAAFSNFRIECAL